MSELEEECSESVEDEFDFETEVNEAVRETSLPYSPASLIQVDKVRYLAIFWLVKGHTIPKKVKF